MPARSTALRRLGRLLVAAGLAVLALVGYQLHGTDRYAARAQSTLRDTVQQDWAVSPGATPQRALAGAELGDAVAILRIPRFGAGYAWVIGEGVTLADLRRGPGHYPGTAGPGEIGNFAVAGHRTTYGAPFGRLDELRTGDAVVLQTRSRWLTYRVTGTRVVAPTDVSVAAPVPTRPGGRAAAALLTFTTCTPRYSDRQRLVVFGRLASAMARSAGLPAELGG